MRVNVDSQVMTDARFKLMARRLGVPWQEVLGRCVVLWMACYESRRAALPSIEIDVTAELDGFADAMIATGLGVVNVDGLVTVCGARSRIEWLESQREKGARGGKSRATRRDSGDLLAVAQADAQAPAPEGLKPSLTLTLALDQDQALEKSATGVARTEPPGERISGRKGRRAEPLTVMPVGFTPEGSYDAQEFAKFADWHEAKGSRFASWRAAWRSWERRAAEFAAERSPYVAARKPALAAVRPHPDDLAPPDFAKRDAYHAEVRAKISKGPA